MVEELYLDLGNPEDRGAIQHLVTKLAEHDPERADAFRRVLNNKSDQEEAEAILRAREVREGWTDDDGVAVVMPCCSPDKGRIGAIREVDTLPLRGRARFQGD